jgi:Type ISP C-terminal specificity domain
VVVTAFGARCSLSSKLPPFATCAKDGAPHLVLSADRIGPDSEEGSNRRENITDWALEQFRARYHDPSISKWDIFHYIYAVLHHPEYRERYAANLRRELPRIPFVAAVSSPDTLSSRAERDRPKDGHAESRDLVSARARQMATDGKLAVQANTRSFDSVNGLASESIHSAQDDNIKKGTNDGIKKGTNGGIKEGTNDGEVFRAFVNAGEGLAEIHVHYEKQPEYPLTKKGKGRRKAGLARHQNALEQGQDFAGLQPIPHSQRHPA